MPGLVLISLLAAFAQAASFGPYDRHGNDYNGGFDDGQYHGNAGGHVAGVHNGGAGYGAGVNLNSGFPCDSSAADHGGYGGGYNGHGGHGAPNNLIADPHDPHAFHFCVSGHSVGPMYCAQGTVFDAAQKICTWSHDAGHGSPGAFAHGNPGAFAHGNPGALAHGNHGAFAHGNPGALAHGNPGAFAHGPNDYDSGKNVFYNGPH